MRLRILDSGHGLGTRLLFALIQTVSRQPVLDVIRLVRYRADFYGEPMGTVTQETMRGPSAWSVGDRELMAAFVAKTNQCEFCTKAHAAVARQSYGDGKTVSALLSDPNTAAIDEPLPAMLLMLSKLTRDHTVNADDMRAVLAAGVSRQQIGDALAVCFSFNVIGRLADVLGFSVPDSEAFEAGAKYLLARGCRRARAVTDWDGSLVRGSARENLPAIDACWLIPCFRHSSPVSSLASDSFSTPRICSSVYRLFFIRSPRRPATAGSSPWTNRREATHAPAC
jgi:uncharacterized peroxidase-related enzyme